MDTLITALRSPALSAEQLGEAATVTAMLEVLPTEIPVPSRLRSRRGLAIAAVTVASLGVGGLAAAGPGFFQAAADHTTVLPAPIVDPVIALDDHDDDQGVDDQNEGDEGQDEVAAAAPSSEIECVGETHGDTVSSIARATEPGPEHGQIVSEAAHSECPKIEDETSETAVESDEQVECVGETHGDTVSSIAQAIEPGPEHGQAVSDAAQSDCGKTADDADSDQAPGRSGDAPGHSDEPQGGSDAPGRSAEAPGSSGLIVPPSDEPKPPSRPDVPPPRLGNDAP